MSAVPFTTATVAMLYVAHLSAVRDERKWHMIVSLMAGALFLGVLTPLLGKLRRAAGVSWQQARSLGVGVVSLLLC